MRNNPEDSRIINPSHADNRPVKCHLTYEEQNK